MRNPMIEPERYEVCSNCLKFVEEEGATRVAEHRNVPLSNGTVAVAYDYTYYCHSCYARRESGVRAKGAIMNVVYVVTWETAPGKSFDGQTSGIVGVWSSRELAEAAARQDADEYLRMGARVGDTVMINGEIYRGDFEGEWDYWVEIHEETVRTQ